MANFSLWSKREHIKFRAIYFLKCSLLQQRISHIPRLFSPSLPPVSSARYRSRISFRSRLRWSRSDKYFKTAARPRRSSTVPSSPVARLNFRTIVETRVPRTTREFNFPAEWAGGPSRWCRARINSRPSDKPFAAGFYHCITDVPFHIPVADVFWSFEGISVSLPHETREIFRHRTRYVPSYTNYAIRSTRNC